MPCFKGLTALGHADVASTLDNSAPPDSRPILRLSFARFTRRYWEHHGYCLVLPLVICLNSGGSPASREIINVRIVCRNTIFRPTTINTHTIKCVCVHRCTVRFIGFLSPINRGSIPICGKRELFNSTLSTRPCSLHNTSLNVWYRSDMCLCMQKPAVPDGLKAHIHQLRQMIASSTSLEARIQDNMRPPIE